MREYGQIQSSYWTHPDISKLSVEAKLIGAYLLTCQHTNGIGCFRIPIGYVSIDLGIGIETVSKGFQELFENGFFVPEKQSDYVLIPAFLRWNPISNPNSAKARAKEFNSIPSNLEIYPLLINSLLKHGRYWGEEFSGYLESLSEGFRNGSEMVLADVRDNRPDPTRPEQEQDPYKKHMNHEKKNEKNVTYKTTQEFEEAWAIYPTRAGGNPKRKAAQAWNARVKAGASPEDIIAGIQRYAAYCVANGSVGTTFVKQAATFFGPDEHYLESWEIPINGKNRNISKPGSAAARDKTHRELYREVAREGADEENMDISDF